MSNKRGKIKPILWESIDEMPIHYWWELHKTGDIKNLFRPGPKIFTKKQHEAGLNHFKKLKDEFIDCFGVSDNAKEIITLQAQIAVNRIRAHVTGDNSLLGFVAIYEEQLKALQQENEKPGNTNYLASKVHVDKYMGHRVDPRTVSVKEYYSIIDEIKKQHKPQLIP